MLKRFAFFAAILTCGSAHAQVQRGAQPVVPADIQQRIQGDVEGKAQIFSKLLGDVNLKGKVETNTNEVYQKYHDLDKTQIQQYMIWVSCQNIFLDRQLPPADKTKLWIEIYQALIFRLRPMILAAFPPSDKKVGNEKKTCRAPAGGVAADIIRAPIAQNSPTALSQVGVSATNLIWSTT
jgi:hypothetical protein